MVRRCTPPQHHTRPSLLALSVPGPHSLSLAHSALLALLAQSFWLRCEYTFEARFSDELDLKAGDTVFGITQEKGWWYGAKGERKGLFPANFVKLAPLEKELRREWLRREEMEQVKRSAEMKRDVERMRERLASPAASSTVVALIPAAVAANAAQQKQQPRRSAAAAKTRPEVERMRERLASIARRKAAASSQAAAAAASPAARSSRRPLLRATGRAEREAVATRADARALLLKERQDRAVRRGGPSSAVDHFLETGGPRR